MTRRANVDVIILDITMPGMDGVEVAERIKKMPGCDDIPLVFVTAVFREDPNIKRGYAIGAVDYVPKPFDPELLRFKVNVYSSPSDKAPVCCAWGRQLREAEDVLDAG